MTLKVLHSASLWKQIFEWSPFAAEDGGCSQSISSCCNKIKITIFMKYWCHCCGIFGQFRVKNEHVICIKNICIHLGVTDVLMRCRKCASEWQEPWNIVYVFSSQYQGRDLVGSSHVNTINSIFTNIYNPVWKRIISLFYTMSATFPYSMHMTSAHAIRS